MKKRGSSALTESSRRWEAVVGLLENRNIRLKSVDQHRYIMRAMDFLAGTRSASGGTTALSSFRTLRDVAESFVEQSVTAPNSYQTRDRSPAAVLS